MTDAPEGSVAENAQPSPKKVKKSRWSRWRVAILAAGAVLVLLVILVVLGVLGYFDHDNETLLKPKVSLGYATYTGTRLSNHLVRFRGMRYAAPPLGDLRWRAPADPPDNQGLLSAEEFGPICLGTSMGYPADGEDEDCLFINVWAPANATEKSKLPVWLFIQGGGYTANANANWDGSEVIEKSGHSIVFVNFNYRVGLWGFLAGSRVRADGALNAGLLDQRAAMQWVQSHIAVFGGDPDHVVIHGVSAGAGSVALHLAAYGGRDDGLFAGAVAESVFFPAQPWAEELDWQFDRLVADVGCDDAGGADQLDCLRSKDTAVLQGANVPSAFPNATSYPLPLFYWTPCIDGDLIQDLPYTMFEKGNLIKVPVLFGNDNNEGSYFAFNAATSSDMTIFMKNNYPHLTSNDTASIVATYPLMPAVANHNAWFPSTSAAYGEATFICPGVNILDAYYNASLSASNSSSSSGGSGSNTTAAQGLPLWSYRYNVQDADNTASGLGVPHVFEAAAVFGPDSIPGGSARSYSGYNAPMVPLVMGYFLSFVRALDPSALREEGAPEWGRWASPGGEDTRSRLVFELDNTTMEDTPASQVARCQFWKGLAETMEQ
ncbi:Carboxylic ester hydrolase [Pleurostoma richardsiae]|uniref:Carboxylic ester hydrolase n=1 Tax=Pleurostoma richardsiae TaxID=41990 RepID=A0AA38VQF2_9PEZI|nr:Carboxylic ester hydrolase [Pleurostoma richardsiae]